MNRASRTERVPVAPLMKKATKAKQQLLEQVAQASAGSPARVSAADVSDFARAQRPPGAMRRLVRRGAAEAFQADQALLGELAREAEASARAQLAKKDADRAREKARMMDRESYKWAVSAFEQLERSTKLQHQRLDQAEATPAPGPYSFRRQARDLATAQEGLTEQLHALDRRLRTLVVHQDPERKHKAAMVAQVAEGLADLPLLAERIAQVTDPALEPALAANRPLTPDEVDAMRAVAARIDREGIFFDRSGRRLSADAAIDRALLGEPIQVGKPSEHYGRRYPDGPTVPIANGAQLLQWLQDGPVRALGG